MPEASSPGAAAAAVRDAYDAFTASFLEITRRSESRFASRDWRAVLADAQERLGLYKDAVDGVAGELAQLLGEGGGLRTWQAVKDAYAAQLQGRYDADLAQTFFNSVSRRFLHGDVAAVTFRLAPADTLDKERRPVTTDPSICRVYPRTGSARDVIGRILADHPVPPGFADLDGTTELVADRIEAFLRETLLHERFDAIHVVPSVFYRNKAAFLMGRIIVGQQVVPLVLSLRNEERGVTVHAVLIEEANAGKLFSNTRSNFHVDASHHREMVAFLRSMFPQKQVYELYAGMGYYNRARTELYEALFAHLHESSDRFEFAPGARGKVMLVFRLPGIPMVFKLIRDRFEPPKTVRRADVLRKYRFVREADRAGRMLDALTFGDLRFQRSQFQPDLLAELQRSAAGTVVVDGDDVVVRHVYAQRQVTPLPEYLWRTKDLRKQRDAVIDFGYLIKDLAAVNIFLGDYLLKNFGVTSYRKVVSFDFDELDLLTRQRFRRWPAARDDDEELTGSHIDSMVVEDTDVFPEEFERFMGIPVHLMPAFRNHHADLFTPEYFTALQERLERDEVIDISSSAMGGLLREPDELGRGA